MSDGNNPVTGWEPHKSFLFPQLKDLLMLMAWIAGLILVAGLCWFLAQPARTRFLRNSVNRVLEESGDFRRLGEPVSPGMSASSGMGVWFTMTDTSGQPARTGGGTEFNEGTRVYVFTFIWGAAFFPCAAVVRPGGEVQEFIALNSHGERMMKLISPGIMKIYARRIEGEKL